MLKTLKGTIHGKTIQLEEEPGVAEGQAVEVQLKLVEPPEQQSKALTDGLRAIYAVLGERVDTGEPDLAERHNEHQP